MQLIVTKPYGIFVEFNNKGGFNSEVTGGFFSINTLHIPNIYSKILHTRHDNDKMLIEFDILRATKHLKLRN